MSTFNFPPNPSIGDTWVIGTTTYRWNGYAWTAVTVAAVSATSIVATTLKITSTTNISTATGVTSAVLQVYGGAWFVKDVFIEGNLYIEGDKVLTTSTFNAGVQDGVDIDIVETNEGGNIILTWNNVSTLQSVTDRGSTTSNVIYFTNTTESTSTNTGAIVVSGGIGTNKRVTCESLKIADAIFDSTQSLVNTTATTAVDSFSSTQFRSAKYLIQIDEGTGANADFELREILLVADNNDIIWATEYGVVTSDGDLGTFAAEKVGTTVTLYFTAYEATNKVIKVLRTGIAA